MLLKANLRVFKKSQQPASLTFKAVQSRPPNIGPKLGPTATHTRISLAKKST